MAVHGYQALYDLKEALGVGDLPLTKIVLEVDVRGPVKVYVVGLPAGKEFDAACKAVGDWIACESVEVRHDATVITNPPP